jgi:PIN domain nuclease of toxin-antitoxin system
MSAAVWLLDTNILLAATIAPERLPDEIGELLRDPDKTVYFSAASIWEVAIKRSLNRESFDFNPEDVHQLAVETGFAELPVLSQHCHALARLPWHHRDPFDRLLVAQAQAMPARLLTSDDKLAQYSDLVQRITLR